MGTDVDAHDDDDGILLMTRGEKALPEGLLKAITRITVKDYPDIAREALLSVGFVRVMLDYVLHR